MNDLLASQSQMNDIHDPRYFTKQQQNLMEAVVAYLWGPSRIDIKTAAGELTEDIAILRELAPSDIDCIPAESLEALYFFGKVKLLKDKTLLPLD